MQVALDRFDLFHAHFFYSRANKLGLLFHAAEFPAHCDAFPYFLGFCQQGSTLQYTEARMDFRNYMWYDVRSLAALVVVESQQLQAHAPGPELLRSPSIALVSPWLTFQLTGSAPLVRPFPAERGPARGALPADISVKQGSLGFVRSACCRCRVRSWRWTFGKSRHCSRRSCTQACGPCARRTRATLGSLSATSTFSQIRWPTVASKRCMVLNWRRGPIGARGVACSTANTAATQRCCRRQQCSVCSRGCRRCAKVCARFVCMLRGAHLWQKAVGPMTRLRVQARAERQLAARCCVSKGIGPEACARGLKKKANG